MRVTFLTSWFIVRQRSSQRKWPARRSAVEKNPGTSMGKRLMWNADAGRLHAARIMVQDFGALQPVDDSSDVRLLRPPYRQHLVTALIPLSGRPWSCPSRPRQTVETAPYQSPQRLSCD
jgi:hypothetical protein